MSYKAIIAAVINGLYLALPVFIGMSLFFERLVYQKRINEKQMNWLSMLNISSLLIIPASIIRSTNTNPGE